MKTKSKRNGSNKTKVQTDLINDSRKATNHLKRLTKLLETATACEARLDKIGNVDEMAKKCESIYDHVNWALEAVGEFGNLEWYEQQIESIDEKASNLNMDVYDFDAMEERLDRVIGKQQQALVNQAILEGLDNE